MFTYHSSKIALLVAIAIVALNQTVLADRRVACPADSSLIGYTSIDLLNADVDAELNAIQSQTKMMEDSYTFILCPFTVFIVSPTSPILVTFNHTNIICGRQGVIDDECTVIGGYNQVMLSDSSSTKIKYASFRGITFSFSEYVSIAAFANSEANAEFYNCAWTYNTGGASILIRPPTSSSSAASSSRHSVAKSSRLNNNGRQLWELDAPPLDMNHPNRNRHHRRDQQMPQAMSVRLFDCNITNGFINSTNGKVFSAVYSSGGFLHMHHVRVADNQGTLLFNLVDGGKAVVSNSTFVNNKADAIWRPIFSSLVQLDQVSFVRNKAEGIVVAIGNSQAIVNQALFYDNMLNQGSNILILEQSQLQMYDSCLLSGSSTNNRNDSSLASIFVDSSSTMISGRNFGNISQGAYCHDANNGTGILVESKGHDCMRHDCVGTCAPFTSPVCTLPMPSSSDLTDPSTTVTEPASSLSSSTSVRLHGSWGLAAMLLWLCMSV